MPSLVSIVIPVYNGSRYLLPLRLNDRLRRTGTGLRKLGRRRAAGRAPSWLTLK